MNKYLVALLFACPLAASAHPAPYNHYHSGRHGEKIIVVPPRVVHPAPHHVHHTPPPCVRVVRPLPPRVVRLKPVPRFEIVSPHRPHRHPAVKPHRPHHPAISPHRPHRGRK